MTESTVKPALIALVICDDIYQEQSTGKTALVGLFNNMQTRQFPVTHPKMAVFVSVTGLRSKSSAKLEISNAETGKVLLTAEGRFPDTVDPVAVVDMSFVLGNVTFDGPGTYFVSFWSNGHLLVMRPFELIQAGLPIEGEQK